MRLKLTTGGPNKWRRHDVHATCYRRFRRRILQRSRREAPAVSTPLPTGRRCELTFDLDPVCQRLELDSPPRTHDPDQRLLQGKDQETVLDGDVSLRGFVPVPNTSHIISAKEWPVTENLPEQGWMWKAAVQECCHAQQTGSGVRRHDLQPFAVLHKAAVSLQGKSVMKLAAPSLQNDYYTNVLDCSCTGMVALALGSSVHLWNSETQTLVGCLSPQTGRLRHQSVSSLCWSREGSALCVGTRQGEIQVNSTEVSERADGENCVTQAVVKGKLCPAKWNCLLNQQDDSLWYACLCDSFSCGMLKRIRILGVYRHTCLWSEPFPGNNTYSAGAAVQKAGICSLQWSPCDDWLASGSTDGVLHIWDRDIARLTRLKMPVTTMTQPSAVKVSASWA
ncbi:uncharacterized protein LOC115048879 isoform X3 [Echeneis naucrates]|uniref:uncharacterized protein LOC115048879 isoform X3 n=1 Tax=Echeneis naucrates TaxID=173247 RepID=UPI0011138D4E|nr:cell division cycle protein 20 homolog B isoform X3 [Echeneis naucrates]